MEQYASAILISPADEFILQVRDDKSDIVDPGKLSLFAGKLENGETPEAAIRRELAEEIGYIPENMECFIKFQENQFAPISWHILNKFIQSKMFN